MQRSRETSSKIESFRNTAFSQQIQTSTGLKNGLGNKLQDREDAIRSN